MKKNKIKLMPRNLYQISATELWLKQMRYEGFELKKCNILFATFQKAESKEIDYKLIPVTEKGQTAPDEKMIEICKNNDFFYVATITNLFHIFASKEEAFNGDDINLPAEDFKFIEKNIFIASVFDICVFVALLALFFFTLFDNGIPTYQIVQYNSYFKMAFSIGLIVLSVFNFMRLRKAKKWVVSAQKKECSKETDANQKIVRGPHLMMSIVNVLIVLMLIILPIEHSRQSWNRNFENIGTTMPYLLLNMVEQNEYYHRYNPAAIGDGIVRKTNSAKRDWSPLAPMQYDILQMGKIDGEVFDGTDKEYTPSSNIEFFRTNSKLFTKPLMKDLMKKYLSEYDDKEEIQLDETLFEEAHLYKIGGSEHFFGRFDNNVIYLSYTGNKSIVPFINDIYDSIVYVEY
ncbi:MAG: DUF2812 domain-containing protein [Oscillospiraceae bacterium]